MCNTFATLNGINVNEHTEKKGGLTYLAWAWAWAELKKRYPKSYYTVYENRDGWNYHTDGRTAWVKTGVTVIDEESKYFCEHIEFLPVMDNRNRSIPLNSITSMDINKAIQRSLTKAVARHGLGLYIYAGEDLPEGENDEEPAKDDETEKAEAEKAKKRAQANGGQVPSTVEKSEFVAPIEAPEKSRRQTILDWAQSKGFTQEYVGDLLRYLRDSGDAPKAMEYNRMNNEEFRTLMYKLDTFKGAGEE